MCVLFLYTHIIRKLTYILLFLVILIENLQELLNNNNLLENLADKSDRRMNECLDWMSQGWQHIDEKAFVETENRVARLWT